MSDAERLREVDRWMQYARDDLHAAELLVGQYGVPRAACFHAQQTAEKAIKAVFVFLQVDFPFTHDLNRLKSSLLEGWRVKDNLTDLSGLSRWAVEPRYPGDLPEATKEEAEAAVEQAREVYETALEDLKRHGFEEGGGDA